MLLILFSLLWLRILLGITYAEHAPREVESLTSLSYGIQLRSIARSMTSCATDGFLSNHELVLVLFHAPWSSHLYKSDCSRLLGVSTRRP